MVPSLTEMSERNPVALLPADAPSTIASKEMTATFHEAGSDNVLVVLLSDEKGLSPPDEQVYRSLVDRLRADTQDVVMLQEFTTTPELRQVLGSHDGKAWILPVGLAGGVGTPESYDAYTRVADIVRHTVNGTTLTANLTGPAATVADLTAAGANDRLPIEVAIAVMLLIILTIIYRNPVTPPSAGLAVPCAGAAAASSAPATTAPPKLPVIPRGGPSDLLQLPVPGAATSAPTPPAH